MSSSQEFANKTSISLNQLQPGQRGQIQRVHGRGALRQRFMDLGLVKDTIVELINPAPLGDPLHIQVRGCSLAIRRHEAEYIECILLPDEKQPEQNKTNTFETTINNLTLDDVLNWRNVKNKPRIQSCVEGTILLAGNPNCGKSTLFNALTGSHQHVGNWPGKTVEKKEGLWVEPGANCRVIDLPGTYSLTAYSLEEIIARDAILEYSADLVVVVLDASNLERNLYLAVQILEMGTPAILVLNMWDIAQSKGLRINIAALSERLKVPVLSASLSTGEGLEQIKSILLSRLNVLRVSNQLDTIDEAHGRTCPEIKKNMEATVN